MAADESQLVLLETSGNQDYIFASNRQRELLGASYLTWASTAEVVPALLANEPAVRPVFVTSGKAILIAPGKNAARRVIFAATSRALADAPGLDLRGVFAPLGRAATPGGTARDAHAAVLELFRRMEATRAGFAPPAQRLPGIPPQARCASTGLPAAGIVTPKDDPAAKGTGERAVAALTCAKLDIVWDARGQLGQRFQDITMRTQAELEESIKALDRAPWIAVIHADGAGVGQIFMRFDRMVPGGPDSPAEAYFAALGKFSAALDACGIRALRAAIGAIETIDDAASALPSRARRVPVVPLVQGGDDLTALCLGRHALPFAAAYLRHFEQETAADPDVGPLAAAAQHGDRRLSACAGVAVVGAHFPFHLAYEMAVDLEDGAKRAVKRRVTDAQGRRLPCSALDFHLHYDASGAALATIREKLVAADGAWLHNRPYVVTDLALLANATDGARSWAAAHHIATLEAAATACGFTQEREGDAGTLPSAPLHLLRSRCFAGKAVADAALAAISARRTVPRSLAPTGTSVFEAQHEDGATRFVTRLLDAIDAARLRETAAAEESEAGEPAAADA